MLFLRCLFIFVILGSAYPAPSRLAPIVRRVIDTSNAPAAIGPYSQAIQIGNLLYVSGEIGIDPSTGSLVPGGIEAETIQVFKNIQAILSESGINFDNVVKTTILLANINDFNTVNQIYSKYFANGHYPARATYQVGALPKNALIEIESIAIVNDIIDYQN